MPRKMIPLLAAAALVCASTAALCADAPRVRARELGVPFEGVPGRLNAITDVEGVLVGQTTLISGSGKLEVGKGPVRTGVTAILPRGPASIQRFSFAGWFAENGNGEMTGTTWVEESGFLEGPVMITNTHSVGVVRDAVIAWRVAHGPADATGAWWSLPVVAETWDGWLNDINGFHVKPEHVFQALDSARSGPVQEGNVGGGTGMICNGYKGGIGTASRKLAAKDGGYTVGVLVQCNYGTRQNLRVAGIPVGAEIFGEDPYAFVPSDIAERGSIIVVVATDAPLLPHQLKRVARRVTLGLGRNGSTAGNGSGRYLHRLLDGQPAGKRQPAGGEPQDGAQRLARPGFRSDRTGDRGGGHQCAGCRRGHDRHRRPSRDRAITYETARGPGET